MQFGSETSIDCKIADSCTVERSLKQNGRIISDPALSIIYIPRNALAKKTAIWARVTGFPGP